MSTTPNMNLLLPIPTITPGPTYATENNTAFTTIDSHDHTTGKGVPIPSNGININNDLPFNDFNATSLRSTRFVNQGSPLSTLQDVGCLYVSNGNLFYNNELGQQVQITSGAAIDASTIGGIGGDYATSTALEFYTSATSTFTFWANTNLPAFLDSGAITLRNFTVGSHGVMINPPPAMAADYNLNLPSLPLITNILSLDTSGNIAPITTGTAAVGAGLAVDASNVLIVPANGIQQSMLQSMSTSTTAGAGDFAVSASCGTFTTSIGAPITNFSITITTTGRPVFIGFMSDGTSGDNKISTTGSAEVQIKNNGTLISNQNIGASGGSMEVPSSTINVIDLSVNGTPGTYTYTTVLNPSGGAATVLNSVIYAYEI